MSTAASPLLTDTVEGCEISLLLALGSDAEVTPHGSESDRSLADLLSESSLIAGGTWSRQEEAEASVIVCPPLAPCLLQLTSFNICGVQAQAHLPDAAPPPQ